MIKVGIVGGTGYTGVELLRLLAQHPQAEVVVITSRSEDGVKVTDMFPNLRGHYDGLAFSVPDAATLGACDVVFFAAPHGVAHALAGELLAAGTRVIDLSADFRLQDADEWAKWYGQAHGAPELLPKRFTACRRSIAIRSGGSPDRGTWLLSNRDPVGFSAFAGERTGRCVALDRRLQVGVSGAGRAAKIGSRCSPRLAKA